MRVAMILMFLCVSLSSVAFAAPITTGSLIDEMIDMHRLTRFPAPAYKTVQFSSYDRRSSVPGGTDWFANSDGFGKEPIPNFEAVITPPDGDVPGEYLMCDVRGPGAIVRLWTARIAGTIRVYLDDADAPLYNGPAEEFLLHPYNRFLPGTDLTPDVLTGTFYQRNASYAPIPFAKRCRMVWVGNHAETHFYEIQMRLYDEGAEVVTFSPHDVEANAERIRRVASILANVDREWPYRSIEDTLPKA
jgi:hypothetical protein